MILRDIIWGLSLLPLHAQYELKISYRIIPGQIIYLICNQCKHFRGSEIDFQREGPLHANSINFSLLSYVGMSTPYRVRLRQ